MTTPRTTVDVHRADTRAHTTIDWLDSRHSFSFGRHYDPANTHHGHGDLALGDEPVGL
ncbi:MAG: hypothetical protein ACR2LJ_13805 [Acidimicrobiales bacterium]